MSRFPEDASTAPSRAGRRRDLPRIDTDIDAAEVILTLAPETERRGGGQRRESLWADHRADHTHLAVPKEDEKIRFRDVVAQPRKDHLVPIWSGLEKVCYNAGYTNVHELIPWRTLTGRQQLYQDHLWMRALKASVSTVRRSTPRP